MINNWSPLDKKKLFPLIPQEQEIMFISPWLTIIYILSHTELWNVLHLLPRHTLSTLNCLIAHFLHTLQKALNIPTKY